MTPGIHQLPERITRRFLSCYDAAPELIAVAPGRVNLIGEHTDYNDGFVMPMAIQRYTAVAAKVTPYQRVVLHSTKVGETVEINLRSPIQRAEPAWTNYVRGVLAGFQRRGAKIPGFNAVIDSDVPLGGGLSSSAALEVATATLLEAITGQKLDLVEKALLCQKAEHEFAGVPCGIMDQFTSVMARADHLLLLDCRSHETQFVPVNDPALTVLIINTNVRHKLVDGEYAQRRSQCNLAACALKVKALRDATLKTLAAAVGNLDPVTFRRGRHVITENERTTNAAAAFSRGDWPTVGGLMYASHASLRDDYEVSCGELDTVVEIARSIGMDGGVIGCRMTGGGFGGCAVALVKAEAVDRISKTVAADYKTRTGIAATIFSSRPSAGATIVKA